MEVTPLDCAIVATSSVKNPPTKRELALPVEWGRLVAAAAVIWIHTEVISPWNTAAIFAVPFFTFIAFYLMAASLIRKPERPYLTYIRDRICRIGYPFVGWSFIYVAVSAIVSSHYGHAMPRITVGIFLRGGAYHLWYLPFLLFSSVLAFPWIRWSARLNATFRDRWAITCLLAAIVISFAVPTPPESGGGPGGLDRWIDNAPMVLAGAACGLLTLHEKLNGRYRWIVIFLAAAGTILFELDASKAPIFAGNMMGICLGIGILAIPNARWMAPIATLGKYALGIYLVHVLFLSAIQANFSATSPPVSLTTAVLIVPIVFVASTCTTFLLNKTTSTRWLLGL